MQCTHYKKKRLEEIVRLVGLESLSERDHLTMTIAEISSAEHSTTKRV